MNILQTLLVIGLFALFLVYAVAPIANVSSAAVDDTHKVTGIAGFVFGNQTFIIFIIFIVSMLMMMWTG